MSNPLLTVILPAYNEEKRLRLTLEAVREYFAAQSYTLKLIVVDDGSTDNTSEVALELIGSVPDLKVLRNEHNRGKGYSVRRGVAAAKGSVRWASSGTSIPEQAGQRNRARASSRDWSSSVTTAAKSTSVCG